ncbi:MAG: type II secretion system protein [Candidatus Komeilibacteria bacterium]
MINSSKSKGFTLIEMVVALAIFSLVISVLGSVSVSLIKVQRKAFVLQNTQEAARYILESISKEIRTSRINSEADSDLTVLNITNSKGETLDYQFDNTNKWILRNGEVISPNILNITGSFYLRKSPVQTVPAFAIVTIVIKVESQGDRPEEQAEIYLQNSIASRSF